MGKSRLAIAVVIGSLLVAVGVNADEVRVTTDRSYYLGEEECRQFLYEGHDICTPQRAKARGLCEKLMAACEEYYIKPNSGEPEMTVVSSAPKLLHTKLAKPVFTFDSTRNKSFLQIQAVPQAPKGRVYDCPYKIMFSIKKNNVDRVMELRGTFNKLSKNSGAQTHEIPVEKFIGGASGYFTGANLEEFSCRLRAKSKSNGRKGGTRHVVKPVGHGGLIIR